MKKIEAKEEVRIESGYFDGKGSFHVIKDSVEIERDVRNILT
ncbi:hypothetical protein [Bacillus sp. AFS017336]